MSRRRRDISKYPASAHRWRAGRQEENEVNTSTGATSRHNDNVSTPIRLQVNTIGTTCLETVRKLERMSACRKHERLGNQKRYTPGTYPTRAYTPRRRDVGRRCFRIWGKPLTFGQGVIVTEYILRTPYSVLFVAYLLRSRTGRRVGNGCGCGMGGGGDEMASGSGSWLARPPYGVLANQFR